MDHCAHPVTPAFKTRNSDLHNCLSDPAPLQKVCIDRRPPKCHGGNAQGHKGKSLSCRRHVQLRSEMSRGHTDHIRKTVLLSQRRPPSGGWGGHCTVHIFWTSSPHFLESYEPTSRHKHQNTKTRRSSVGGSHFPMCSFTSSGCRHLKGSPIGPTRETDHSCIQNSAQNPRNQRLPRGKGALSSALHQQIGHSSAWGTGSLGARYCSRGGWRVWTSK